MSIAVVRVCGPDGKVLDAVRLVAAEPVHRQLRPQIPQDYVGAMHGVFADGGEMAIALDGDRVAGVAVFRLFRNTHVGLRCYVDDLVTDEAQRSTGVGHALINWIEAEAKARGCPGVDLESGVQRSGAHRFYFREGFTIASFSFRKTFS
jgi:GNAT superfamily N-acetyltransferase